MVGIRDVARQAFYAYYDHFFHRISQDERCYYPHRRRGELAARNASTVGKPSNRMNPTAQLLAITNTELNASLVETRQLHLGLVLCRLKCARSRIAVDDDNERFSYEIESRPHRERDADLEVHLFAMDQHAHPYPAHQLSTKDARQSTEGYPTMIDLS